MAEDIKIPGMGELDKKYVIWGVVAGVGVGVIVYFRSKSKAQAAAATDTSGQVVTDPAGNTCSALDANSGYCPGSPEDQAYQESLTGSYSGLGFNGGEFGGGTGVSLAGLLSDPAGNQCIAVNPATGYCPGSPQDQQAIAAAAGGSTAGTGATGSTITKQDWINEALGVVPGDQATIQAALVDVFAGQTVTTAQKNLFMEAVGVLGQPPGGYPTPIRTSDTSAHPVTPTAPKPAAKKAGAIHGLHVTGYAPTGVSFAWEAAQGASQGYAYILTGNGITKRGNTSNTHVSVTGLNKPGVYNFGIQGLPGGPGANIHTPRLKG